LHAAELFAFLLDGENASKPLLANAMESTVRIVNICDAKAHLSRMLKQVQSGEDVVIAKAGTPIVRLVRYVTPKRKIAPPGAMAGEIWIADDFDAPMDKLFDCLKPEST